MTGRQEKREERLIETISSLVDSPELYDSFIQRWQDLINQDREAGPQNAPKIAAVERAAERAIVALSETDSNPDSGRHGPVAVEQIREPAFILSASGTIENLNDFAWERYGIDSGQSIHQIPLEFLNPNVLAETLKSLVASNAPHDPCSMVRCFDPGAEVNSTVLFIRVPSRNGLERQVLMVVNSGEGAERAAQILTDGCDLTPKEHDQLVLFLQGRAIADIATLRDRSQQTVRNQMQSIFDKTGSSSQSDLMRLAFSLSNLFSNLAPALESASRSNRQHVSFLRPDGRVVDATLAGAKLGKLVISLPSIFGHPLTPDIEAKLTLAGIRMVCVARPGMGKTDPPPDGMSEEECVAADIEAILDQLQAEHCVLLGRASAAALIFKLCPLLNPRLSNVVVVNAVVPTAFVEQTKVAGHWTRSLITAAMTSESVARLILRSGRRLMRVIGPKKFLTRMYAESSSDVAVFDDPNVVRSVEDGVSMVTAQGFEAGSRDMTLALNDWSADVESCPLRVTIMQGTNDPNVPIESSRSFAKTYPDQCRLIEISGGGLLSYSHCGEFIAELLVA